MSQVALHSHSLTYWIADIEQNPVFKPIIASAPFQRLADISFLGAIDYLPIFTSFDSNSRTRFAHSLGVAGLANFISTRRNYASELRQHLIAAALLHDIGHPPLSHSVEPYLNESHGLGHHEIGAMIIDGKLEISRGLHKYLQQKFDLIFIKALIDRSAYESDGGDLFAHKINIDTIDGVIRGCECYLHCSTVPRRLDVAQATFLSGEHDGSLSVLDFFWGLKHTMYKNLVNDKNSILADTYSSSFFNNFRFVLSLKDILTDEIDWQSKYSNLFNGLSQISQDNKFAFECLDSEVAYIDRDYWIDSDMRGDSRFKSRFKKRFLHVE